MDQISQKSNMKKRSLKPKDEETRDEPIVGLDNLPDDVLYAILLKLDIQSLGRVCRTCRRLQSLAEMDFVWTSHGGRRTLMKESDRSRHMKCSTKEKVRLSYNWENAVFQNEVISRNRVIQMPWLECDEEGLWASSEQHIKHYSISQQRRCKHMHTLHGVSHDITHFVLKGESVVAGCSDGSVVRWKKKSETPTFTHKVHYDHTQPVHVDARDNLVVSGTDGSVQLLDMDKAADNCVVKVFEVEDRVWSVGLSPDGRLCVGGTAASTDQTPPLIVWDLASLTKLCTLGEDQKKGAGVFDIKFESPHLLLTGGYDTILRLWDTRTFTCVSEWEEPFDYPIYCIESDNNTAMFTGTARSSMTRLWDKRKTQPVSMYHPPGRKRDSPVFSVAFNASHLFVALDLSIHKLDFSIRKS